MNSKVLVICTALLCGSTGALAEAVDPSSTQARGTLIRAHVEACSGLAEDKTKALPKGEVKDDLLVAHFAVCLYARGYVDGQAELKRQYDALATYNSI